MYVQDAHNLISQVSPLKGFCFAICPIEMMDNAFRP